VEIKDVVENLADPAHYARLSTVLGCEKAEAKKVAREETKVRDAVVGVLRRHSVEDIRATLAPCGRNYLRR
jgi:flagellar basal body-associated protein FliL